MHYNNLYFKRRLHGIIPTTTISIIFYISIGTKEKNQSRHLCKLL